MAKVTTLYQPLPHPCDAIISSAANFMIRGIWYTAIFSSPSVIILPPRYSWFKTFKPFTSFKPLPVSYPASRGGRPKERAGMIRTFKLIEGLYDFQSVIVVQQLKFGAEP